MKNFKRIISVLTVIAILLCLCSCGKKEEKTAPKTPYDKLKAGMGVDTGVVTENDNFILSWDSERAAVMLTDKNTNDVWSTIPYDYYKTGETSGRANIMMGSPLMLEYVNTKNKSAVKSVNGYTGIIKNGKIGCQKTESGLKVYYFFDKLQIVIPVDYTLRENGIYVSISPKEIKEFDNLVYRVSLAPFMCSAKNSSDKENSYLVVPSGSGALMYTDVRTGEQELREYSENVYGDDPARYESEKLDNTQTVRMPIFGAKNGDAAICAIIEEGAASASVDALVGDEKIGWSAVYPTFSFRGSNVSAVNFTGGSSVVETISEEITGYEKISVGYYPLSGEKANYSGMAEVYKKSLENGGSKIGEKKSDNALTLNIIGGLQVKSLILGIPYMKTVSVTTFKEALDIIKGIKNETDMPIDAVLSGFGESGVDIGKLAGGYGFSSVFGSKKSRKSLIEYCKDKNIPLYFDFDIVRFNNSSNGFSATFDAAKSSNSFTAYQYHYSVALRDTDKSRERYVLLNRSKLTSAADKLFKLADKSDVFGIGLSTLGSIAYSDYDSAEYFVRGGTEKDVSSILNSAREKGFSVAVGEANAYAAANADKVFNAPVSSSEYDIIDRDIPLYQMVFGGITDVSAEPVNTAVNTRKAFLKSIEGGIGLSFVLSSNYDSDYAYSSHSALAVSKFSDNLELIKNLSLESREYYEAIKGAKVIKHSIISDSLRKTEFDNGVCLWVNYSDKEVKLPEGTVEAESFMFRRDKE